VTLAEINELRAILKLDPVTVQWLGYDMVREAWIEAIELSDVPPSKIEAGPAFWKRAKELGWKP
jgi:hypothetical protein